MDREARRPAWATLNIIDLFPLALEQARMELAAGPQFTLRTATDDLTRTGKWRAGVATLAIALWM
jgi:hypothetical protein